MSLSQATQEHVTGQANHPQCRAPGTHSLLLLCLGSGLPNPALQALCKLITASETGEQLISRVSTARC